MTEDYDKLMNEILEKNIVGEKIEQSSGGYDFDEESLISYRHHELLVDGEPYEITYII